MAFSSNQKARNNGKARATAAFHKKKSLTRLYQEPHCYLAGAIGIEPISTVLETAVLPLN